MSVEQRFWVKSGMAIEDDRIIPQELTNQLDSLVESIIHYLPCAIRRIVLFGSYQRGEAKAESDIDIAVLIDEDLNWQARLDEKTSGRYSRKDKIRDTNRMLFRGFIDSKFPQNRFSIIVLTPGDLEYIGQLTDERERGNVALNVLQGFTLFSYHEEGWWQDGRGLRLTSEPVV